ncbi:hypothetical protein [Tenacibaculum sp. M341]|uniref:hypothetical protein n=1 Tax=Tenacibaculum sp. M341 TaxID=2530339 RepID=UPI0010535BE8|nr:hypothetical protein [Tenacibaculum sp. M341]TCI92771.1 hypothetical protein EYW44_07695 [Tenacibaculum sp. M341]
MIDTIVTKNKEKQGAKIALFYGLLFSFFSMIPLTFIFLILLFSVDLVGLVGIGVLSFFLFTILTPVLTTVFPIALWYLGKRNVRSLLKGKTIIRISTEFSFGTNLIVWLSIFIFLVVSGNTFFLLGLIYVIPILFIVLSTLTTFTIGLFIVKKTKKKMKSLYDFPKI